MLALIVGIVMFVAVMLVATLVAGAVTARREAWRHKVEHRLGVEGTGIGTLRLNRAEELAVSRWLRDLLDRAGDHDGLEALFVRMAVFGLAATVVSIWLLAGPAKAAGLLCVFVPLLLLRSRAIQRSTQLTIQLPDALDRIARTLRAGHAFSDALRLAAAELPDPIGEELARVSETHRLGVDMRQALESLSERNNRNFDLRLFVGAVLLHRDTGGNLVEILDQLAETVRERTIFHQKVRALTAEVNVSAIILGALPFIVALALLAVQPDYLRPLFRTDLGHVMLAAAGASLVAGGLLMRRLAMVEV